MGDLKGNTGQRHHAKKIIKALGLKAVAKKVATKPKSKKSK